MLFLKTIYQLIVQKITPICGSNANMYTWWILEHVLKKKKALLISSDILISSNEQQKIDNILYQLIHEQKPLQYILNILQFGDLMLFVEPPILIPRHETEEWVLWLCNILEPYKEKKLEILDIGTGSGCIALSLAKMLPHSNITAIDISKKALNVAKKNAAYNQIKNINFLHSDIFTKIKNKTAFDVIVSNPPYIDKNEIDSLDVSVKKWEDPQALICEDQGLEIIKKIIKDARNYLKPHTLNIPSLVLEIGHNQGTLVQQIMQKYDFKKVTIYTDYFSKGRMVYGYF